MIKYVCEILIVTLFIVCTSTPVQPTDELAQHDTLSPPSTSSENKPQSEGVSGELLPSTEFPPVLPLLRGHREGKAIGQPPPNSSTVLPYFQVSIAFPYETGSDISDEGPALQKELALNIDYKKALLNAQAEGKNVSATEKIGENVTEASVPTEAVTEISNVSITKNTSIEVVDNLVPNKTVNTSNTTVNNSNNTAVNSSSLVKNETVKENSDRNVTVVELSTAKALLLETNVGRRAADSEVRKNIVNTNNEGLDAGAVAGICFGSLVVVGLAGATSLVLYRRRYLNKPQTLNDKCSNPDSSGYIDDSTIRENSEEMYSLDNDSFLNSLEAMTIQNYWTDSVKHTKL